MGTIKNLILFLYVLIITVVLMVFGGIHLGVIPRYFWQNNLLFLLSRPETLFGLIGMGLLSLGVLVEVFLNLKGKTTTSKDVSLRTANDVEVKVAVQAIIDIVECIAVRVNGVREARASMQQVKENPFLKIKLSITLGQGFSAKEVSEKLIEVVDDSLKKILEIPEIPVEVEVTRIAHAVIERDRRVV